MNMTQELPMHPTKHDLPTEKRVVAARLLNDLLANLIDLQIQAKHAHWNVKGPHFIALHELFDRVAEEVEDFTDKVAERIAALGGQAEGTIGSVGQRTKLSAYPPYIVGGRDHLQALAAALATVARVVRGSIDRAAEIPDADTADLFTEVSRGIDKQLWFVEAHLQGDN